MGIAGGLYEAAKPVGASRKDDVSDPVDERCPRRSVGRPECAIAQQRLDATPFASSRDARVELAAWLSGAGSIAPPLREDGSASEDPGAGTKALCGHVGFDPVNTFEDEGREFVVGDVAES